MIWSHVMASLPVHLLARRWPWQVSHTGGFCSVTFCCVSVCHETLSMCCLMSDSSTAWILLMFIHHFISYQSLLASWARVYFIPVLAVSTQNLSIVTKPLGEKQHNYNFMTNEFKMTPGENPGNFKKRAGMCGDFLFTCLCKACWDTPLAGDHLLWD